MRKLPKLWQTLSLGFLGALAFLSWPETADAQTATALAAGGGHTCALTTGGHAKCWGWNGYGQLGDGTTTNRNIPVYVKGLTEVTAIGGGGLHTCAVVSGGSLKCWGNNKHGQLGDGTLTDHHDAISVSGLSAGVIAVAAGYFHTCALTDTGGVKCWGQNKHGQLGDGTTVLHHTKPVDVSGLTSGVIAITAGEYKTCARMNGGGVKCWGGKYLGDGTAQGSTSPIDIPGLSDAAGLTLGSFHGCAVNGVGAVKCWGSNADGQLGDGTTTTRMTPVNVVGLAMGVEAVSAGWYHTCSLMRSGSVKCWGYNYYGELGDGTNTDRSTPVRVIRINLDAKGIVSGVQHSCALTAGGAVKCWGYGESGELGNGSLRDSNVPVPVVGF